MRVNLAHLREHARRGGWINFAVFEARSSDVYKRQPTDRLLDAVAKIGEMTDLDPVHVLAEAKNILREKWDWAMPEELLRSF